MGHCKISKIYFPTSSNIILVLLYYFLVGLFFPIHKAIQVKMYIFTSFAILWIKYVDKYITKFWGKFYPMSVTQKLHLPLKLLHASLLKNRFALSLGLEWGKYLVGTFSILGPLSILKVTWFDFVSARLKVDQSPFFHDWVILK